MCKGFWLLWSDLTNEKVGSGQYLSLKTVLLKAEFGRLEE